MSYLQRIYTRGTIPRESIKVLKGLLVALSQAFDVAALDQLIFLQNLTPETPQVSVGGVLHFTRLIGAGLAQFKVVMRNGPFVNYEVELTPSGVALVKTWQSGDTTALKSAHAGSVTPQGSGFSFRFYYLNRENTDGI